MVHYWSNNNVIAHSAHGEWSSSDCSTAWLSVCVGWGWGGSITASWTYGIDCWVRWRARKKPLCAATMWCGTVQWRHCVKDSLPVHVTDTVTDNAKDTDLPLWRHCLHIYRICCTVIPISCANSYCLSHPLYPLTLSALSSLSLHYTSPLFLPHLSIPLFLPSLSLSLSRSNRFPVFHSPTPSLHFTLHPPSLSLSYPSSLLPPLPLALQPHPFPPFTLLPPLPSYPVPPFTLPPCLSQPLSVFLSLTILYLSLPTLFPQGFLSHHSSQNEWVSHSQWHSLP